MKIWMQLQLRVTTPCNLFARNEFNRIDLFVSRASINSKCVAQYSNNTFCFMLRTDSFILTFFLYSK